MGEDWPLQRTTLRARTAEAVADAGLKANVGPAVDRFADARVRALGQLEDPDGLRRSARAVRRQIIERWDEILARFADAVLDAGGNVCWAADGAEANAYIVRLAREAGVRRVVKSKSMATEETGLNGALEAAGCDVVETDLGEWIVQLADEHPSHIIVPAMHRNRGQIADVFERRASMEPGVVEPEALVSFARRSMRRHFVEADLGITGVNFGVAESGSIVLVTNEGNGRLVSTLPPIHVAVMGAERVVETFEQLDLLLALLARSATGQALTSYTSIITGARRPGELDGPEEFHLVIVDNGRAELAGTEFEEMLNCIRCGACLNVCPVYRQTGGHAYGWVYPGPMGAVLTPLLAARESGSSSALELADASTLCGACMEACPVEIPLQDLLLGLRRRKAPDKSRSERASWRLWAALWSRPRGFHSANRALGTATRGLARAGLLDGVAARIPGAAQWVEGRALPDLPVRSFRDRWASGDV